LTTVVAALHLAVANRYDLFRDELYFIVCGRHPAFGYVDQPPLVPLLDAATYALGAQTWVERLPAVVAAAALVWVVVKFARLLGGGNGAAWCAGAAAGFAPMLMGLTATVNTTTFEPLAWTLVAYGLARVAIADDRRAPLWAGLVAGLAMEAKYALPLWLAGLAAGLIVFPERRILRYRELWIGVAIATLIALPSVLWQAAHGFPFRELVRNAHLKDIAAGPLPFALNQLVVITPLFAALALLGLIAPFAMKRLRAVRFIPVAFALAAIAIVAGGGKDYYLAAAYPPLFALGSVAFEAIVRNAIVRGVLVGISVAGALVAAPLALPILSPPTLVAYQAALHIHPAAQERGDAGDALPPTFADMLGWHDFVREVGAAYDSLPPAERARTAIVVDNYGEAAALDVYGYEYHLPEALSGHNQYFLWAERGQHPVDVLRVQNNPERLAPFCATVKVFGTTTARYARDFENGKTIALCRGLHPDIATIWPSLKVFI